SLAAARAVSVGCRHPCPIGHSLSCLCLATQAPCTYIDHERWACPPKLDAGACHFVRATDHSCRPALPSPEPSKRKRKAWIANHSASGRYAPPNGRRTIAPPLPTSRCERKCLLGRSLASCQRKRRNCRKRCGRFSRILSASL